MVKFDSKFNNPKYFIIMIKVWLLLFCYKCSLILQPSSIHLNNFIEEVFLEEFREFLTWSYSRHTSFSSKVVTIAVYTVIILMIAIDD